MNIDDDRDGSSAQLRMLPPVQAVYAALATCMFMVLFHWLFVMIWDRVLPASSSPNDDLKEMSSAEKVGNASDQLVGFVHVSSERMCGKGWSRRPAVAAAKLIALSQTALVEPLTQYEMRMARRKLLERASETPLSRCIIVYVGGEGVRDTAKMVQRCAPLAKIIAVRDDGSEVCLAGGVSQ